MLFKKKRYSPSGSKNKGMFGVFCNNLCYIMNSIKDKKDKIILLDYYIELIAQDIQANSITRFLWKEYGIKNPMFPFDYYDENGNKCSIIMTEPINVHLPEVNVVSNHYDKNKILNSLRELTIQNYNNTKPADNFAYYPYLNLIQVLNDNNHHAVVGKILKKGTVPAVCYDITKMFKYVDTDGEWFIRKYCSDKDKYCLIEDYRIACIYRAAQQKYFLENSDNTYHT